MKIFLDTANVDEIKKVRDWGLLDGVTTNPSLAAKELAKGISFKDLVAQILRETPGPVSVEVVATDYDGMLKQALRIGALADNAVVKIPMTLPGLKTIKTLTEKRIPVNCTLIFNPLQALFAASDGFVVTPSSKPQSLTFFISSTFAVSKNIFISYPP